MSERINIHDNRATIRWKLLTGVSALALTVSSAGLARAEDNSQPLLWVELGGELNQMSAPEEQFAPPFILATPRPMPETVDPLSVGHPPRWSFGEDAKISFEPEGTDWVFSAAIRYGRSSNNKTLHQQSYPTQPAVPPLTSGYAPKFQKAMQFIDVERKDSEKHNVLDFQAGKDVGLGMFGAGSTSQFSVGVRFAQFQSRSNVAFKSDPDAYPKLKYIFGLHLLVSGTYHLNAASLAAARSFRGIGPSIAWNGSVPVAGTLGDGEIALDWGANAALLFGRQRAKVHHQTTAQYHKGKYGYAGVYNRSTLYRNVPPDQIRSRSVTVPNIGGFAGLSFRYADAKLSLGYRGDFFFGPMDGGIDARKSENLGFHGPYTSISFGLGD
jgi:iron complex outermembrane recepter protein